MSWSETITDVAPDDIAIAEPVNAATVSARDQFDTARDAAELIARSGAVGDDTRRFNVHLTGHACPDHVNGDGSREVIQVAVTQIGDPEQDATAEALAERPPHSEADEERFGDAA